MVLVVNAQPSQLGLPLFSYFASGSNHPAEIRGLSQAGTNIGVAAQHVSPAAEAELLAAEGFVFIDSGAFSEVTFGPRGPEVVKPMDENAWENVFALYERLAPLGRRLFLVAPDQVGNQAVTLERCTRYAERIRALRARGVRWIVPVQKGASSMADFDRALAAVLGFDDFVRGIPSKKDATSTADLATYLQTARPRAVHLLGIGPVSKRFAEVLAACASAGAEIFCDSVAIRRLAGRTNGRGGQPRALTSAQDAARDDLSYERWGATDGMVALDYTDAISEPSSWLTEAEAKTVTRALRAIPQLELTGLGEDIDAWLARHHEHPAVALVFDAAWARFHDRAANMDVKRRGVVAVLG